MSSKDDSRITSIDLSFGDVFDLTFKFFLAQLLMLVLVVGVVLVLGLMFGVTLAGLLN